MIGANNVIMTTLTGRRYLNGTVKDGDGYRIKDADWITGTARARTHANAHAPATVYKAVINSRAEMAT